MSWVQPCGRLENQFLICMTKILLTLFVSVTTIATPFLFVSCQDKSREELILGKWKMDEKEYGQAQMLLEFKNDKTSVVDRIVNWQSTFERFYNYKLIDYQKYLLLKPADTTQNTWKIEIVTLDNNYLKLRSQSPDSSLLILKRQK